MRSHVLEHTSGDAMLGAKTLTPNGAVATSGSASAQVTYALQCTR
jgi:hypothetical protein